MAANKQNGDWLPGYVLSGTPVRSVIASFVEAIGASTGASHQIITLCYYSASVAGWRKLAPVLVKWMAKKHGRVVRAYVGTDHGLTDPDALDEMIKAGVQLRLLTEYEGIYHPKVIHWDEGGGKGQAWIGSHNLSGAAFETNVEFGVRLNFSQQPVEWTTWVDFVEKASVAATPDFIKSYRTEREAFAKKEPSRRFVWSKRKAASKKGVTSALPALSAGTLVLEIMDRETGQGGKQIQPPIPSLPFFGLGVGKNTKQITARLKGDPATHQLTLTRMANATARLHVAELDYGDRPCFMLFRRNGTIYEYEIVSQAAHPKRFQQLDALPLKQTRIGSRRWMIV